MISTASAGGTVTNYSDRFTLTGMTGTFTDAVTTVSRSISLLFQCADSERLLQQSREPQAQTLSMMSQTLLLRPQEQQTMASTGLHTSSRQASRDMLPCSQYQELRLPQQIRLLSSRPLRSHLHPPTLHQERFSQRLHKPIPIQYRVTPTPYVFRALPFPHAY